MIPGIDDSALQGKITPQQWVDLYAQGKRWSMHRLSQGMGKVDGTFGDNVRNSRAAGLYPGLYCVFIPGTDPQDDPEKQALRWFQESNGLGKNPGEMCPTVDFEIASKQQTPEEEIASLCTCITTMKQYWDQVFIYSYPDMWKRYEPVATPEQLAVIRACLLWYACYQDNPPTTIPLPFTKITLWQASGGNKFNIPDAGAPTDADFFMGSEDELNDLVSFTPNVGTNPLAGATFPLDIPGENT
jgi:GH25 family lysozyme M1 (1,4-beta-N-acetylmuramidase)